MTTDSQTAAERGAVARHGYQQHK